MNRVESRNDPFRLELTTLLKSGRYNQLLDIHSFPAGDFGPESGQAEIVLLVTP